MPWPWAARPDPPRRRPRPLPARRIRPRRTPCCRSSAGHLTAFPIGNFFDHDKPIEGDANGYVLTLCGARDTSQVDGHPGYDWRMPEGTPLLAVADAVVMTAGLEAPNFCPQLNRTVQALLVVLVHTAPTGEPYANIYGHLSRIDVQAGASVSEGTVIGLSGNTGCSGTPHLHFGVGRSVAGRYVLIDPYGWHAPTGDPVAARPARRGERVALERRSGAISSIMVPIASVDTSRN